jgi:CRP-like cAMP-binding protein
VKNYDGESQTAALANNFIFPGGIKVKEEDSQSLNDTISPQLKTLLDSLAVDVQMAKDDYLFSEGNQADKLYMIRSGRILNSAILSLTESREPSILR